MSDTLETAPAAFAVRELAVAQARALARRGRHAEARQLLDDAWEGTEPGVAYLDLRARIHAQQGQLEEADSCWARAEQLQPGQPEFTAARRRIARMRERNGGSRGRHLPVFAWLRYLVFLAVAAVVVALLVGIRSEVNGTRSTQETIKQRLAQINQGQSPRPSSSPADVLVGISRQAHLPGVDVKRLPNEVVITFRSGLFSTGTTLTPQGRTTLERLGARLRPYADQILIAVAGYTDATPVGIDSGYGSNAQLSDVRAADVEEVLRANSGIPTASFSTLGLGSSMPLFKQSARNRTANLRISVR